MKLTYKQGKGDKIHLLVDDEYFITVDSAYFADLHLKNGQQICSEELDELKTGIGIRRAYNYAVSLLSRRDHSEKELITKLTVKGHGEFASYATEKLKEQGYLDDERFAESYAKELIRLKSYGKRRVEQELYRKGVDREIISVILEKCQFNSDTLSELIERKYIKYLSDEKGVNKTVNALLRLGYSYSEIRDAIKEIIQREELEFAE